MTRPDWLGGAVRHYCPLCVWHLDVPVHHDMAVTGQMVRSHFATEHGLTDVGAITARSLGGPPRRDQEPDALDSRLTRFQIELPASAGTLPPQTATEDQAAAEEREERVRYDCPMCDWHTSPADGGTRQNAHQQLGGHLLGIHRREPAELVRRLIQLLPNRAGDPRPVPNRVTARLADHLSRAYDFLPLEQIQEEDSGRAGEHWAAAHDLRPWLKQLPKDEEEQAFKRGWDRAMARAKARIAELEAVLASRQQDDAPLSGDLAVDWAGARQDPRYDTARRVLAGLETVDGETALPSALQELAALKLLGAIREAEAAK